MTDHQGARVEAGAAGVVVAGIEGEGRRALLGQTAAVGDETVQGQVVAAGDSQVAEQLDGVADRPCGGGVQGGVGRGAQGAAAQRGIVVEDQLAVGQQEVVGQA